jgi:L-ascorbate metabolism protein UlaG (beta-lactamase superfamily)
MNVDERRLMKNTGGEDLSISIRWFVRSWVQIKGDGKVVYVDPAYVKTYFTDYDPIQGQWARLEKADLILVTHPHKSHCKRETVDVLRARETVIIAPENCMEVLEDTERATRNLRTIRSGERDVSAGVGVVAVPAYNTEAGHATQKLHPRGFGVGYLITMAGRTIYHAGDTDFIPAMRGLSSLSDLGQVDVALLPIDGTFAMDISEAVDAVVAIKPKVVIPIHRLDADPQAFADAVAAVCECAVVPLRVGEVYEE